MAIDTDGLKLKQNVSSFKKCLPGIDRLLDATWAPTIDLI